MAGSADHFARFANVFLEPLLLVSSPGGRIADANRSANRLLLDGRGPADDRSLTHLIEEPADEFEGYLRLCSRSSVPLPGVLTLREGSPERVDRAFRCSGAAFERGNGNGTLVMLRLTPKESAASRFVALNQRIEQLTREVARRLRAEEAVHAQREMLRVTLASIGDAVITTDVHGCVTFMNPIAEAHTGFSQDEAVGRPLEAVFDIRNEDTDEPVESPVRKVLETGRVVGLANHTVLIRKDSRRLPIDDSGAPILDSSGRLHGVVLVFHEISERRKMERELLRQAQALREADERKNQFLAMLAHELRNPLAPLRNGVQILRAHRKYPMDTAQLADMMERQTRQLTRLVDDLLDISRITRGTIRLDRTPRPLSEIIEHAVETVRPAIDAKQHRLDLDLPPEPLTVEADLARLSQVFCNLLTNAAKFMEPGGRIAVAARADAGHAVVSVRDQGAGLSEEFLPHIFDLFTQENRGLDRAHGGLGIGLTLVKTLVDMHGGKVAVASDGVGKGSEFEVRLPLAERQPLASPSVPAAPQAPRLRRVLIVDDNADAAETLGMLLTEWGCDVGVSGDGPSALRKAGLEPPDVVLLDIGLPGMDGFEVARRLRRTPGVESTMLVAVTGYGSDVDRERSREAGFDHHLAKPVDFDVLRRLLG